MSKIPNRQAICNVLCKAAETNKDITVLCSDSRGSSSMTDFFKRFPKQSVEMGIAEQNLVSVGAGLALCGKKVFAASPACFLASRSYEQVKVDVAYNNTDVKLIGVSGGVSYGALGATHHSLQDIAAFCALPDMRVYLPCDVYQTERLTEELLKDEKPAYIRVSRTPSNDVYNENSDFVLNKAHIFGEPENCEVALIACGEMVYEALQAKKILEEHGISVSVIDMYCLKPFDSETVIRAAKNAKLVVTVEEHSPFGGLGALVSQVIISNCPKRTISLSLPDGHIVPGTNTQIFKHYGLDGEKIAKTITEALK